MVKATTKTDDRATATVAETARRLGVSLNTTYEAVHSGQLPSIKIGGRYLVPRAALDRLLSEGQTE